MCLAAHYYAIKQIASAGFLESFRSHKLSLTTASASQPCTNPCTPHFVRLDCSGQERKYCRDKDRSAKNLCTLSLDDLRLVHNNSHPNSNSGFSKPRASVAAEFLLTMAARMKSFIAPVRRMKFGPQKPSTRQKRRFDHKAV